MIRPSLAAVAAVAAAVASIIGAASAQQLYRWTDEQGKVHITDRPPPPSAKDVQKKGAAAVPAAAPQLPFEVTDAMKNFPVTLYSVPTCKDPCQQAREVLNRRGVPFKEIVVFGAEAEQQFREVAGEEGMVPMLTVGRSVQKGFSEEAYEALLDSARYPKPGVAPARSQAPPPPPKDYVDPSQAKAEPIQREQAAKPGPYAPKAPVKPQAEAPRLYAPIPGKDADRTGPYAPKPVPESTEKK